MKKLSEIRRSLSKRKGLEFGSEKNKTKEKNEQQAEVEAEGKVLTESGKSSSSTVTNESSSATAAAMSPTKSSSSYSLVWKNGKLQSPTDLEAEETAPAATAASSASFMAETSPNKSVITSSPMTKENSENVVVASPIAPSFEEQASTLAESGEASEQVLVNVNDTSNVVSSLLEDTPSQQHQQQINVSMVTNNMTRETTALYATAIAPDETMLVGEKQEGLSSSHHQNHSTIIKKEEELILHSAGGDDLALLDVIPKEATKTTPSMTTGEEQAPMTESLEKILQKNQDDLKPAITTEVQQEQMIKSSEQVLQKNQDDLPSRKKENPSPCAEFVCCM
jgi:hypothetical protein